MCQCHRDAAEIEEVERNKMGSASKAFFTLLKNEVYITLLNTNNIAVWDAASNNEMLKHYKQNYDELKKKIKAGEDAIRQFNTSWRFQDDLQSFRLVCHGSRIFIYLLDQKYKLIILNRLPPDGEFEDPLDFEKQLKEIVATVISAIKVFTLPHADLTNQLINENR